jgi:hypothetical protein
MTSNTTTFINKVHNRAFLNLLLDLIDISDSFDQLKKLALISDLLYSPFESEWKELAAGLEHTARHLKGLPALGGSEVGSQTKDFHDYSTFCNCSSCQDGFNFRIPQD